METRINLENVPTLRSATVFEDPVKEASTQSVGKLKYLNSNSMKAEDIKPGMIVVQEGFEEIEMLVTHIDQDTKMISNWDLSETNPTCEYIFCYSDEDTFVEITEDKDLKITNLIANLVNSSRFIKEEAETLENKLISGDWNNV